MEGGHRTKEKGKHGVASHKRPTLVPCREDGQLCGEKYIMQRLLGRLYGLYLIKIAFDRKNRPNARKGSF
jgi:hypothetical protein